jgi:integrase
MNGSKTYFVRYRLGGRGSQQRRYSIGSPDDVRLGQARKLATKALADVRFGHDPVAERRVSAKAAAEDHKMTIAELIDAHEAEQRARKIVTAKATATMLRRDFAERLGPNRAATSVTRTDLVACIDKVRDGSPGHTKPRPGLAPTFRARLYGIFETAVARGIVQANPLAGYRRPRESRAQRIEQAERRAGRLLSMEEIAALWAACGDPRMSQSFGAYVRMLVVSGCRRTELAAARISWIKPATSDRSALMVIPAAITKTGRQHVLPLATLATGVISEDTRTPTWSFLAGGHTRQERWPG